MAVPRQRSDHDIARPTGPRARMRRLMVETASRMMRDGGTPSVSDVAEVARVSRSTAYRYFPTQAAMVQAVVGEALGGILSWTSDRSDPEERISSLFHSSFPRLLEHEATFRSALRQSLDPGDAGARGGRGHRIELLERAVAGLTLDLTDAQSERLVKALALTFGVESIVVLKDICGLDDVGLQEVALWAACAMVRAAIQERATEIAVSGPAR